MSSTTNDKEQEASNKIVYSVSESYWASQPPTVNGMLGGFDFVSDVDIEESQKFLDYFLNVTLLKKYQYNPLLPATNHPTFLFVFL
jgi:hypothetical protein